MKIIGRVPPVLLYLLICLSTLTETIYSPALPNIAKKLGTTGEIAQLSTTVYYLGFAIGIFTLGRISDLYGRKPVVLFGIVFYSISSLMISSCKTIEGFIILRMLQAYGASVGSVVGQAMTRDSYAGWELSYIYASVATVMAIVPSLGSAIGGYIIEYFNWETSFHFLTTLGLLLVLVYTKFLPETNAYIGNNQSGRFFTVVKSVFQDRLVLSYAFMVGAYNGICFGFYIQAPFILIDELKMPPSDYGKMFLLLTLTNLLGSIISIRLIKRFVSIFTIKISGLVCSIIGCSLLLISSVIINIGDNWQPNIIALMIFIPMSIHLMGHSLIVPMLLRDALEDYQKVRGSAGAIFGAIYYIITASVSFMVSFLHSHTIDNFALLFAGLITLCLVLFYFTTRWRKNDF